MRGQRDKVAFFFRRADAFFVALAILLLFSCGLPTSDYLYRPADFSASGNNPVRLEHDTRNIDDSVIKTLFKGYDIYYRIFDDETDAQSSSAKLSIELTSGNIAQVASSEGYYVLVKDNDDDSVPLIPVSDNTYRFFDLHLNSESRWTITAGENNITLYYILRNKSDSATEDFFLTDKYESNDHDYAGSGISEGGSVHIVFFAVAYGISSSSIGSEIYSDPIVLEPIQYTPTEGS